MKESYKRLISGIIYTLIFIVSLETYLSFTILTFIFGIICCYEFNKISQQKGKSIYVFFSIIYLYYSYAEFYFNSLNDSNSFFNDSKDTLLIISIFLSLFLMRDLFSSKNLSKFLIKKYLNFIFYLASSFVFIYLIAKFINQEFSC